ncbi:probable histone-lysine N-methyltransferase set-23 [Sycon ciliatum]|uniref:probable histone-lysine N-methyltransferase set-23 n=1 Tax=Sycon ciliatum TaxID=27933 RepID=UPI0031F67C80
MSAQGIQPWPYSIINTVDDVQFPVATVKFVRRAIGGRGVDLSMPEGLLAGCNCSSDAQCSDCDHHEKDQERDGNGDASSTATPSSQASQTALDDDDGDDAGSHCTCTHRYGAVCDPTGRLLQPEWSRRPLLECGPNCACPMSCGNRYVQRNCHGARSLAIYRRAPLGWAVRTLVAIKAFSFVCEYAGLIVRERDARKIDRERGDNMNFLLILKERRSDSSALKTHVDASTCGNVSRFFNHSCAPNLDLRAVRTGSIVPRLAFFAQRDIVAGEDLAFSYGDCAPPADGDTTPRLKCNCGAENCGGFLPFDANAFPDEGSTQVQ